MYDFTAPYEMFREDATRSQTGLMFHHNDLRIDTSCYI